jgi:trehalose/maltose hydrolase-like predicted phosphorylase
LAPQRCPDQGYQGRPNKAQHRRDPTSDSLQPFSHPAGFGAGRRYGCTLTGQAYEGHYFWDTEIYLLPFLTYTSPRIARNLLTFRYKMLPHARARAQELGHRGAMFPWRTISGEEASAYYAAGTAQYHINADIMYALRKYVQATGDELFLRDYGAEMLVETARLFGHRGRSESGHGGPEQAERHHLAL